MAFFKSSSQAAPGGAVVVDGPVAKTRLREAYDKGRLDERKRHHRSPVLTLLLCGAALVGVVFLFYAFREGSFAGGGAAVDGKIAQVSSQAAPAVETAASDAGALAEKAGDKLKSQGEAIKQDAPASGQ
jgi:hypothetical protein